MKGARKSKRAKKKKTRRNSQSFSTSTTDATLQRGGTPPRTTAGKARERYLTTLAPDRRFIVELDDLMERMWKKQHSIAYHFDKEDWELWPLHDMFEALERHCEKVRSDVYYCNPDKKLLPKPKAPRTNYFFLVPLTEGQEKEWEDATPMEQRVFFSDRYLFGTWFKKNREGSNRGGRPSDRAVEFRSMRIAAYTQFREWEGEPHKGAIADAMARYKCSRATVYAARKQWCPQMKHLLPHFDQTTAKEYRERIEQFEDRDLVRLGLDKSAN
jgi:hypothetical protein